MQAIMAVAMEKLTHEWEEIIWHDVSETPALLLMSVTKPSSQPEKA